MVLTFRAFARFFFICLPLFTVSLAASSLPAAAASERFAIPEIKVAAVSTPDSEVQRQVRLWADQLSSQKPFEDWKQATPDIQALGPGTHGWLATLKNASGRIVGYMVVHASQDGTLRLSEYGVGPGALFDPAMLDRTLRENGLIGGEPDAYRATRYYAHPFAAVWQVAVGSDVYWVDAKTGELLPLVAEDWNRLRRQLSPAQTADAEPAPFDGSSATCWIGEPFDAYETLPWVSGAPSLSVQDEEKVQRRLRGSLHLRYVVEPYGEAALYAVPVVGFLAVSGGRLDLAVDMNGTRFIPIGTLKQYGRFYA